MAITPYSSGVNKRAKTSPTRKVMPELAMLSIKLHPTPRAVLSLKRSLHAIDKIITLTLQIFFFLIPYNKSFPIESSQYIPSLSEKMTLSESSPYLVLTPLQEQQQAQQLYKRGYLLHLCLCYLQLLCNGCIDLIKKQIHLISRHLFGTITLEDDILVGIGKLGIILLRHLIFFLLTFKKLS